MRGVALVSMVVAASGCTAARVECAVHGGPVWHEARSERLVVRSNLPREELQTQVTYLEQLLTAMQTMLEVAPLTEPIPLLLVHPGDLAALGHEAPPVDGLGKQTPVLVEGRGKSREWFAATHELAHLVIARAMPAPARWLQEGLASFLESTVFHTARDVSVGTGLVGYQYAILYHRGMSPDELWRWGKGEEPANDSRNYAHAWGIVRYLMLEEPQRFKPVLAALRAGEDGEAAFNRAFPSFARRELPAAMDQLSGGLMIGKDVALPGPPPPAELRELSPGEVHLAREEVFGLAPGLEARDRQRRMEEEHAIALELGTQPGPAVAAPAPPPEEKPSSSEPELMWAQHALDWTSDRPSEAAQLIDESPAITDIVALRRVWVAAAVLGDCERLRRVQEQQVPRFEASHATETAQLRRRFDTLCGSAPAVPEYTCPEGQLGYPDEVITALLADRSRRMGTLTAAVSSVEPIDGDLIGTVPLTVRADGHTEVGAVQLEPPRRLLITAFTKMYERLPFPKPCGGDVAYDVPVSLVRPKQ